jgi:hypothetical protein
VKVFGRVLNRGGVAATDVAATQAQAQVDPSIAHLQALFAAIRVGLYFVNLIQVGATIHGSILNLDLQQTGGGFSQNRSAVGIAEARSLENLIDGGGAPGKWIVGAEHDLAGSAFGHQVA